MIYHTNVLLWKLFLAKGDTGDIFWGIVKGVICGIIRTTAD
jgi:hypothetical protein